MTAAGEFATLCPLEERILRRELTRLLFTDAIVQMHGKSANDIVNGKRMLDLACIWTMASVN
jgi:hypothetical protein